MEAEELQLNSHIGYHWFNAQSYITKESHQSSKLPSFWYDRQSFIRKEMEIGSVLDLEEE